MHAVKVLVAVEFKESEAVQLQDSQPTINPNKNVANGTTYHYVCPSQINLIYRPGVSGKRTLG